MVEILTSRIAALEAHFAALADDVVDKKGQTDMLGYDIVLYSD